MFRLFALLVLGIEPNRFIEVAESITWMQVYTTQMSEEDNNCLCCHLSDIDSGQSNGTGNC